MIRLTLAALTAALVSGCASIDDPGSPLAAALEQTNGTPLLVECSGNCKTEWERAQLWLVKHSAWKIQSATDVLLQTYSPVNSEPSYGFIITKEPIAGGRYNINMSLHCGNLFGCSPRPVSVLKAFAYYVTTGTDVLAGHQLSGIR